LIDALVEETLPWNRSQGRQHASRDSPWRLAPSAFLDLEATQEAGVVEGDHERA
jgi:hypothetical protein